MDDVAIPPNQPYSAARERHQTSNGIAFIWGYIDKKGYKLRIATGNAFGAQAQDPAAFVAKIEQGHFYAWDFISAAEILEKDRVTPNATFPKVARAMQQVLAVLRANAGK